MYWTFLYCTQISNSIYNDVYQQILTLQKNSFLIIRFNTGGVSNSPAHFLGFLSLSVRWNSETLCFLLKTTCCCMVPKSFSAVEIWSEKNELKEDILQTARIRERDRTVFRRDDETSLISIHQISCSLHFDQTCCLRWLFVRVWPPSPTHLDDVHSTKCTSKKLLLLFL